MYYWTSLDTCDEERRFSFLADVVVVDMESLSWVTDLLDSCLDNCLLGDGVVFSVDRKCVVINHVVVLWPLLRVSYNTSNICEGIIKPFTPNHCARISRP